MSTRGVAVVTGGAGGIGQALLVRLGQDGYVPVSWDLSTAGADNAIAVDVTVAGALAAATTQTLEKYGPIRALIVNAGILGPVAPVWELAPADIKRVLDVNLLSAFLTLGAVIPAMLQNKLPDRGRIVLMASVQGKEGTALAGPYAASKAGIIALTKTAGKELAEKGILVNAVAPTVVRTAMETSLSPERRADLLSRIPMRRFIDPAEVAAMVSFLCGPDCSFSTGAVFDLSGGRSPY